MPIYEYECKNCHQQFDLMQKIHDQPASQCPQCFKHTAVRLVSAAGFQLKGSGWYASDFKNKNNDNKKNETAVKPEGGSNDKSESTPKPSADSGSSTKGEKD